MGDYSKMPQAWVDKMSERGKARLDSIMENLDKALKNGKELCPEPANVFKAFHLTPPDKVKTIIIDKAPYYSRLGEADGLAYSCANASGDDMPGPLKVILTELEYDLGYKAPPNGDLSKWAKEGVLLTYSYLTCEVGSRDAHLSWKWREFTTDILRICRESEQPIVYNIWGSEALSVTGAAKIDGNGRNIVVVANPHARSARKGFLFTKPFSRTNALLEEMGALPIDWQLNC